MSRAHAVKLTFDGGVPGVTLVHTGPCDQGPNYDGECVLEDWVENVGGEITHGEITVPVGVEWLEEDSPTLTLAGLEQHHVLALLGAIRPGATAEDDDLPEALDLLRASLPGLPSTGGKDQ